MGMKKPEIHSFFDERTFTATHLVSDPETGKAAIIDPVLDFDLSSGRTNTASADSLIALVKQRSYSVEWILETHIHADHLSSAPYLQQQLGGKTGVSNAVPLIQKSFGDIFNAGSEFATDGSQFDHLFADDEAFSLGGVEAKVMHTPGHTPACAVYIFGDAAFVGDTLFMPDFGSARCDFPGGDARTLYNSIQKILALPDETRLFTCHDYKAPGRDQFAWESTVAEQHENNVHLGGSISEEAFVKMREERDAQLSMPKLILPAVQVNMRAGKMPPPEDNGVSYLKLPVNAV
ncbi:MAG: hypothetical protein DHS20C05_02350 [Hyphococcus sp.]|nr:MAG: hypothetical protein DHS20C05_02350 [Marinicaulis sp.]